MHAYHDNSRLIIVAGLLIFFASRVMSRVLAAPYPLFYDVMIVVLCVVIILFYEHIDPQTKGSWWKLLIAGIIAGVIIGLAVSIQFGPNALTKSLVSKWTTTAILDKLHIRHSIPEYEYAGIISGIIGCLIFALPPGNGYFAILLSISFGISFMLIIRLITPQIIDFLNKNPIAGQMTSQKALILIRASWQEYLSLFGIFIGVLVIAEFTIFPCIRRISTKLISIKK